MYFYPKKTFSICQVSFYTIRTSHALDGQDTAVDVFIHDVVGRLGIVVPDGVNQLLVAGGRAVRVLELRDGGVVVHARKDDGQQLWHYNIA